MVARTTNGAASSLICSLYRSFVAVATVTTRRSTAPTATDAKSQDAKTKDSRGGRADETENNDDAHYDFFLYYAR